MSELSIVDLDTLRADTMRRLLNEEGRTHIWKYDIVESRVALAEARADYDYDNITIGAEAMKDGKRYALIGPGICDHHFSTPEELVTLLEWLCRDDGYLACYMAHDPRLCFPALPQCSTEPYVGNRCRSTAELMLYAPGSGTPNPGGYVCRRCGYDVVSEYWEKLGERWTLRPLHKYHATKCVPSESDLPPCEVCRTGSVPGYTGKCPSCGREIV